MGHDNSSYYKGAKIALVDAEGALNQLALGLERCGALKDCKFIRQQSARIKDVQAKIIKRLSNGKLPEA